MYVIDIAWQSVPYGLYSTEPEGLYKPYSTCICIVYLEGGVYAHALPLLGSNSHRTRSQQPGQYG